MVKKTKKRKHFILLHMNGIWIRVFTTKIFANCNTHRRRCWAIQKRVKSWWSIRNTSYLPKYFILASARKRGTEHDLGVGMECSRRDGKMIIFLKMCSYRISIYIRSFLFAETISPLFDDPIVGWLSSSNNHLTSYFLRQKNNLQLDSCGELLLTIIIVFSSKDSRFSSTPSNKRCFKDTTRHHINLLNSWLSSPESDMLLFGWHVHPRCWKGW